MPRKRGWNGTGPPPVLLNRQMKWPEACEKFVSTYYLVLTDQEYEVMTDLPWNLCSMPGLWSRRGAIWRKHAGQYPKPADVGLPPDHDFFVPQVVDYVVTRDRQGNVLTEEWFHHGRKIPRPEEV